LTRDEADEAASTIDMITELVGLGALSRAQGSAIIDQLAMDMAHSYRERQQEERAHVA
jgi:hypothetical protein